MEIIKEWTDKGTLHIEIRLPEDQVLRVCSCMMNRSQLMIESKILYDEAVEIMKIKKVL